MTIDREEELRKMRAQALHKAKTLRAWGLIERARGHERFARRCAAWLTEITTGGRSRRAAA